MNQSMSRPAVLLVEDEFLIAILIEEQVAAMQFDVVVATSVAEALDSLGQRRFELAILDYHLRGETAEAVAAELLRLRVPFSICTGLNDPRVIGSFPGVPIIEKPFDDHAIPAAIASLIGRTQALAS